VFPPELDLDFGPLVMGPVLAATPIGEYEFSCRILSPVTGELMFEDLNTFQVQ
jgi:hypothetical protein